MHGNHIANLTRWIKQINPVQITLRTRRNGNLVFRNFLDVDQVCLQRIRRHVAADVLRLKQHNRSDVIHLVRRFRFQRMAAQHRIAHRVAPMIRRVLREQNRQLDHLLRFQLAGRNAVQLIGFLRHRRRCQIEHCSGSYRAQHVERLRRFRVMRLIHNHNRSHQRQQICGRRFHPADIVRRQKGLLLFVKISLIHHGQAQLARPRGRHARAQRTKVRLKRLAETVNTAVAPLLHTKRLNRRHHHNR